MTDPHISLLVWIVGLGFAVTSVFLGVVYFVFTKKADYSALNIFISQCQETMSFMSKNYLDLDKVQGFIAERVSTLEVKNTHLERSIEEIKQHVASVDRKVHEINGGILIAIREFRTSLENQMKFNQALLMKKDHIVDESDRDYSGQDNMG